MQTSKSYLSIGTACYKGVQKLLVGDDQIEPLLHKPESSYVNHTLTFLNHIFGEQHQIRLDYFKTLLLYPTHILPFLCLTSKKRNIKKTAFLDFRKAIFGDNITTNSNKVCQLFQVTKPTIYDWIKHGKLKPYKIRTRVYFLLNDIPQLLQPDIAPP
jgi:predicted DNA-binding transcriptional regulator AlpA